MISSAARAAGPRTIGVLVMHAEPRVGGWFERVLRAGYEPLPFSFRCYDVLNGQIPASKDECDGYILSGSPASVYDATVPWIPGVLDWMRSVLHAPRESRQRLVGICFGHQLLAAALTSRDVVAKSPRGWGVGPRRLTFAPGFTAPWLSPARESVELLFSHEDQVAASFSAPTARVIATSSFCPVEAIAVHAPGARDIPRALSFQAHVEYPRAFMCYLYASRVAQIGAERTARAISAIEAGTAPHEMDAPRADDALVARWLALFLSARFDPPV